MTTAETTRARHGGREARRDARAAGGNVQLPFIRRKIATFDILDEEALEIIEANAEIVLEEIGVNFPENPRALALWRAAGADGLLSHRPHDAIGRG